MGRRGERRRHEPVARPVRIGIEELVLLLAEARIDVDQGVDAADPRVGRESARVVEEDGHVVGRGRRAVRPDGQHDRRELALAEGGGQAIERGPGRNRLGEDRRVGGVEADMQERQAEQDEDREGRDEDGDRLPHDPPGEARPGAVRIVSRRDRADRERVDPRADDREEGREEGEGGRGGEQHDDRAGDPDGAQDHELEEDQPGEPQQHGQTREEDGSPGGRDGRRDRRGDAAAGVVG